MLKPRLFDNIKLIFVNSTRDSPMLRVADQPKKCSTNEDCQEDKGNNQTASNLSTLFCFHRIVVSFFLF